MHFFILILFINSFTVFAQENKSAEKIKIDLKIELPKDSLLNLIIKASSTDSAECVEKGTSEKVDHHGNQSNLTTSEDKTLQSYDKSQTTNGYIVDSTTKSILFVRKFIKFCALDTNENKSLPLEPPEQILISSTHIPPSTQVLHKDTESINNIEDFSNPSKTTSVTLAEKILCPENFRNFDNRCIFVSTEFKNWYEAKLECEEVNSRLIIPDTIFTFERIILPVAYELNQDFWINAYFNVEFDEWLYPLTKQETFSLDFNQTNDLALEKVLNNQMIYIDPNENKEWFCNPDKLKSYSTVSQEHMDNYLAMSWSEDFGRSCIDNFNFNINKRVVCELN